MKHSALATDYDGTLASGGKVSATTQSALERMRATGYRLVLVTGRRLDDLLEIYPGVGVFDRIVAENGPVLHDPRARTTRLLASPPPPALLAELRRRCVAPLSPGCVVVAASADQLPEILGAIRSLRLDLHVVLNKGSAMVLPRGTDKASGLAAALAELHVPADRVVAIGDAENDRPLIRMAGLAVATSNAVEDLKREADLVLEKENGEGVRLLLAKLLQEDPAG